MPSIHAQLYHVLHCVDTGAYTSFVNREVAKWLEQQQHGGTVAGAHQVKSSRHDVPTSEVGLAGTQLSSSIYGTVVFDLTLFNEVTKSDNILKRIEAIVIDSCIEVIAKVRREPAAVEQMKIVIDEDKWRLPCNRAPPRKHSEEKQRVIRKQVDAFLELGVIKES